jgi:quercetin dioxygenase-like cupin family protein
MSEEESTNEVLTAFGQEGRILVSSTTSGGALTVIAFSLAGGSETPPHVHHRESETIILHSGEVEAHLPDRVIHLRSGDAAYLPKGIPHRLKHVGTEPIHATVIAVPGGFDLFWRDAAKAFAAGRPEMAELARIAADHGIEFLNP